MIPYTADTNRLKLSDYGIELGRIKEGILKNAHIDGDYIIAEVNHMIYTYMVGNITGSFDATINIEVPIDETRFPDAVFREYVKDFDKDDDDKLSAEELNQVTAIDVSNKGIESLKGIEYFVSLATLDCQMNSISELDLTANTKLTGLKCYFNEITKFDLSKNSMLSELSCSKNKITSLDVSGLSELVELKCSENQMTELKLGANDNLKILYCSENKLTSLDVSGLNLTQLYCNDNSITVLDLGKSTDIKMLECQNNKLTELDITNVSMGACISVNYSNNNITHIDFGPSATAIDLNISENPILAVNSMKVNELTADNIKTYYTVSGTLKLSNYNIDRDKIVADSLDDGSIDVDENGDAVIKPDTGTLSVKYTYQITDEQTVECSVEFAIPITEEYFPDGGFREYLSSGYDSDGNGYISRSEAILHDIMDVITSDEVSDLTGI